MPTNTLYTLALLHIPEMSNDMAEQLIAEMGSAECVLRNPAEAAHIIGGRKEQENEQHLKLHTASALQWAEDEMQYAVQKNIQILTRQDAAFPQRLLGTNNAPHVLYYIGNANLNELHVLSFVGTRNCTAYGRDMCHRLISELKEQVPDLLVVSGLAYGIDICAQREAMAYEISTVGVLAHGLDRIYPAVHRKDAVQMVDRGGLLSEYPHGVAPERMQFLQRNRIVAGMADATIVVESASHGGSLTTAGHARSNDRPVFACPGRATDEFSAGCNRLIREGNAYPLENVADIMNILGWKKKKSGSKRTSVQGELFADLSPAEQKITGVLSTNSDGITINQIMSSTALSYAEVSQSLFTLEMNGLVEVLGNSYRLRNL